MNKPIRQYYVKLFDVYTDFLQNYIVLYRKCYRLSLIIMFTISLIFNITLSM